MVVCSSLSIHTGCSYHCLCIKFLGYFVIKNGGHSYDFKADYYLWWKYTFLFSGSLCIFPVFIARLHLVLCNAKWWTWRIQGLCQCIRLQHNFAFTFCFVSLVIFPFNYKQFWNLGFTLGEFWCKDGVWYDSKL